MASINRGQSRWRLWYSVLPAVILFLGIAPCHAKDAAFDFVVLGARGGIEDGNLSAYLIKPSGDDRYLALDAGTLVNGLRVAEARGAFADLRFADDSASTHIGDVLKQHIRGYVISHAHFDHIAGLIVASPDDTAKPIYGLASVLERLSQHVFNWEVWPNFGDTGHEPRLKKYAFSTLAPGSPREVEGTAMSLTAFPLSHGGIESTAFLIESKGNGVLYFGDTGPDEIEKRPAMHEVWDHVAGLVPNHALKAIIIEASYPNAQPDSKLYGHLTPAWLLASLREFEELAGGRGSLRDLPIVVSHIKFSLLREEPPEERIRSELDAGNDLGVHFILPQQGDLLHF